MKRHADDLVRSFLTLAERRRLTKLENDVKRAQQERARIMARAKARLASSLRPRPGERHDA